MKGMLYKKCTSDKNEKRLSSKMNLRKSKKEVNFELRGKFVDAMRHGDADQMRRWATPFLNSVTMPPPRPQIPDEHEIKRWEAIAEQEIETYKDFWPQWRK
jgi:hypothetical protein